MSTKENPYIKVGNLWFHIEGTKKMTFKAFEKMCKKPLKGITIEKAAKELGVKVPTKKENMD